MIQNNKLCCQGSFSLSIQISQISLLLAFSLFLFSLVDQSGRWHMRENFSVDVWLIWEKTFEELKLHFFVTRAYILTPFTFIHDRGRKIYLAKPDVFFNFVSTKIQGLLEEGNKLQKLEDALGRQGRPGWHDQPF